MINNKKTNNFKPKKKKLEYTNVFIIMYYPKKYIFLKRNKKT